MENDFFTLTGIPLADLPSRLDEELPAEAYSQVPGGADLTDIDPNWMRKIFNHLFGLCGLGWGYNYQAGDIEVELTGETGQRSREATLKRLEFWFLLVDSAGQQHRCQIPASGGSENRNAAYALKGAITSAIGNAASNIGFQESVYLGHRSHQTVRAKTGKPGTAAPARSDIPTPAAPSPNGLKPGGNGAKPAATPAAAPAAIAEPDAVNPGDFIIPLGKNQGKKLSEVTEAWVKWAANDMQPTNEQAKALQEAARAYLSQKGLS